MICNIESRTVSPLGIVNAVSLAAEQGANLEMAKGRALAGHPLISAMAGTP